MTTWTVIGLTENVCAEKKWKWQRIVTWNKFAEFIWANWEIYYFVELVLIDIYFKILFFQVIA